MSNTYTLISSNTLTTDSTDVTFSNIPGGYTDLVLKCSMRADNVSTNRSFALTINNDTASNYSRTILTGDGSSVTATRSSSQANTRIYAVGGTATSNTFSNVQVYIPSYTASQYKQFFSINMAEDNNATAQMWIVSNLWLNNSAITSIKIADVSTQKLVSGSSFFLYGIKDS